MPSGSFVTSQARVKCPPVILIPTKRFFFSFPFLDRMGFSKSGDVFGGGGGRSPWTAASRRRLGARALRPLPKNYTLFHFEGL